MSILEDGGNIREELSQINLDSFAKSQRDVRDVHASEAHHIFIMEVLKCPQKVIVEVEGLDVKSRTYSMTKTTESDQAVLGDFLLSLKNEGNSFKD